MSTRHSATQANWPTVYLDEDVRAEVMGVFASWAAPARFARDVIGAGHPDEVVLSFASSESAILVTSNAKHFLRLARVGKQHRGLAMLLVLSCSQLHSSARVMSVQDLIEGELRRRNGSGAHGVVFELGGNWVRIDR